MSCACHSLALYIGNSFEKLPSSLGFLLREIPSLFTKLGIRREGYLQLFNAMSGDDPDQKGVKKTFTKLSATRWLVRGKVIVNIVDKWFDLESYFVVASMNGTQAVRFKARMIADAVKDEMNLIYFYVTRPIVKQFEKVNALFQSTDADAKGLVRELMMLSES